MSVCTNFCIFVGKCYVWRKLRLKFNQILAKFEHSHFCEPRNGVLWYTLHMKTNTFISSQRVYLNSMLYMTVFLTELGKNVNGFIARITGLVKNVHVQLIIAIGTAKGMFCIFACSIWLICIYWWDLCI